MSSNVVGRGAELEALDEFLSRVPQGFVCFALEGEAGVGKTTVWQEAIKRASDRGLGVLACRPSQSETRLPFAALGDLLSTVGDEVLAALPGPQRHALEVALLRVDEDGQPPDQRAIGVAVLAVLRHLAASAQLLVAVDDAQWLDAPTASILGFAARRLDAEPIGMLAAVRLTNEPATTFDRVVVEARRRVVRLGPMSLGALHELLSLRLGHVFPRPTLVKIGKASGGNSFFALEIARELLQAGEPAAGAPLPVPGDLRELVARRVRRLPEQTREALLAAAALSQPTTALVDEAALGAAEQAEIVQVRGDGRIVFSHPLYASAVYESASVARRGALHRRLAELVEEVDERAQHLALGTVAPDEAVAQALERGAARARARGAWQTAAELLEQARVFTAKDRPDEARRLGIAAAEHHAHAGDRGRARGLLEQILVEVPGGPARAEALRLLGQIYYHEESFFEAERLLEEARQHASDPRQAVEIELDLVYAAAQTWNLTGATVHAQRALELAKATGHNGQQGQALGHCAMIDYLSGRGIDWQRVEQALALEDPNRLVPLQNTPSCVAGCLLLYAGRLSEARERLIAVRDRAVERGDESDLSLVLMWLVWLETQMGNFQVATGLAEEAALLATLTGSKSMRAWVHAQSALARAHRGEVDSARWHCAEATALAEQTASLVTIPWIVAARCLVELSVGDAAAAWQAAEQLVHSAEAQGVGEPVGVLFLPVALEALVQLDKLDRAEALLDTFQRRARELDRVWALATGERCRGLVLAARGDLSGAAERFQQALVEHQRLEMPFELARTLLCFGQVQRRRKLRKEAREVLSQALEIFERLGTPLWADKARAELERTHVRQAPQELTPSEQRVAELAGSGITNKQIAERLFLSPKTVEANLARAYIKLGITSRAELGAKMATLPGVVVQRV